MGFAVVVVDCKVEVVVGVIVDDGEILGIKIVLCVVRMETAGMGLVGRIVDVVVLGEGVVTGAVIHAGIGGMVYFVVGVLVDSMAYQDKMSWL